MPFLDGLSVTPETPHFRRWEFACPCCGLAIATPALLAGLEALRARLGRAIPLVSGTRCARHNEAVGGAERSQHMYGLAVDLDVGLDVELALELELFSGLGVRGTSVVHLDMRHLSPETNWTGSSPQHPAVWSY